MEYINERLGYFGRMLSGSKTGYHNSFPDNLVVFNANLCTAEGKIWYGDIDITVSKDKLVEIAKELNETIYILFEMDGRFEYEGQPLIKKHLVRFTPDGKYYIGPKYINFVEIKISKSGYEFYKMLS